MGIQAAPEVTGGDNMIIKCKMFGRLKNGLQLPIDRAKNAVLRKHIKVGDFIEFSSYPQSKSGMDDTPIERLVLAQNGDTALLISKYALDCQPYNEDYESTTWENCTLRSWLNNDFYNKAFSADEQQYIVESTVTTDKNPDNAAAPGIDTTDKVFLLSINEVNEYFANDVARICYPTDYAVNQGSYTTPNGACWWWLRSPGGSSSNASDVGSDGSVYSYGSDVTDTDLSVRPVVWVRLF